MPIGSTLTEEALDKALDSLAELQREMTLFKMRPLTKGDGAPSFSPPWPSLAMGDPRGYFTHIIPAVRFVESPHMVEPEPLEDWSRVRSWSRAKRRRKQGYRQNIKLYYPPRKDMITVDGGKTYLVHPETLRAIREHIREQARRAVKGMETNPPQF